MRRVSLMPAVLFAAAAVTATATPAHAQLGKLKKLGAEALEKATKEKTAGKTPETAKSGSADAAPSTAKKANYTITTERLELVLASLEPLVTDAERMAAASRAEADYSAKRKAADACLERAQQMFNPMSMMTENPQRTAKLDAISKQMDGVNKRSEAAMKRDDFRASIALRDTAMALAMSQAIITMGANCTYPYLPVAMIDAQAAAQQKASAARTSESSDGGEGGTFEPTPAAKEAMTPQEFGMVRERAALWALSQTNPTLASGAKFTPDEEAALGGKAAQLKKLGPLFASNSLRWSTWGDLRNW